MKFFNRELELRSLRNIWHAVKSGKFNFVVITGRRGVGKTRLLFEFANRENVPMIYLFVEKKGMESLLSKFIQRVEYSLNIRVPKVKSLEDFLFLLKNIAKTREVLVVFDEFQNFKYCGIEIFSVFQEAIDEMKFEKNLRLIIVAIGSMIGMLREIFESEASPLYGRRTSEIFLKPFEFWEIRSLLKDLGVISEEEIIEIYSMLGGMPRYYDTIDRLGLRITKENVIKYFTVKTYPGWREVRNELIEEFREAHATYFSILEAIATGNVTSNEIANYTGIREKSIHKYLNELANYFEIIEKRVPVLASKRARGARYFIRDPFYSFWFRYIFPNSDLIELEQYKIVQDEIIRDLPNYVSFIFEEIIRRTILKIAGKDIQGVKIPIVNYVGSWWDRKGNEVNIVGTRGREIRIIGEVKWRKTAFTHKDLEKFIGKMHLLNVKDALIIIVSRGGFTESVKKYIEEKNGLALTLKDLEEVWERLRGS